MRASPAASLLAPFLGALVLAASCGTDATGIEDCRAIEEARCEAAEACGAIDDASACKRFYRDQCLHGLSVPAPGGPVTDACVAAIHQITECARASTAEASTACARFRNRTQACKLVPSPQNLNECNFLTPGIPPIGEGGAGGEPPIAGGMAGDGAGGASGGAVASGGSTATGGALASGGSTATGGSTNEGGSPAAAEGGTSTAEGGSTSSAEGGGTSNPGDVTGGTGGAGGTSAG